MRTLRPRKDHTSHLSCDTNQSEPLLLSTECLAVSQLTQPAVFSAGRTSQSGDRNSCLLVGETEKQVIQCTTEC